MYTPNHKINIDDIEEEEFTSTGETQAISHISLKHRFIHAIEWKQMQNDIQEFRWKGILLIPYLLFDMIFILWIYIGAILQTIIFGLWIPLSFILGGKHQFHKSLEWWDDEDDYDFRCNSVIFTLIFLFVSGTFLAIYFFV